MCSIRTGSCCSEAFRETGGVEVDSQGDGFFVAFRSAGDAVRAAASAQRALAEHRWPEGEAVRVRIGHPHGRGTVVDEGYRGLSVHRTARICDAAHGGQVLVSSTTRDIVEADLPPDVHLRDLGLVATAGHRPSRAALPTRHRRTPRDVPTAEGSGSAACLLTSRRSPRARRRTGGPRRAHRRCPVGRQAAGHRGTGRHRQDETAGRGASARRRAGLLVLSARGSELELEFSVRSRAPALRAPPRRRAARTSGPSYSPARPRSQRRSSTPPVCSPNPMRSLRSRCSTASSG